MPSSPIKCRDLRPALSTKNNYKEKADITNTKPRQYTENLLIFALVHGLYKKCWHMTHRHHSESSVDDSSSNSGIDGLLHTSLLKDSSGVIEHLHT